jgi:hypothetical protein
LEYWIARVLFDSTWPRMAMLSVRNGIKDTVRNFAEWEIGIQLTGGQGAKGITPFNLYRSKLVDGNGSCGNLQFRKHFWEKEKKDYEETLDVVKKMLDLG